MTTSVRLDPETERSLTRLARSSGRSKSAIIRDAILLLSEQAAGAPAGPTFHDKIADVVGIVNRGRGRRAARSEELLREMFAARRAKK